MSLEHASCILYMAVGMMYAMLNETIILLYICVQYIPMSN